MMREMSGKASTGREESKNVCPPIWSSFFCAQRVELGRAPSETRNERSADAPHRTSIDAPPIVLITSFVFGSSDHQKGQTSTIVIKVA